MKRAVRFPWVVPAALALAALGLVTRGSLSAWCLFPLLGVFPGVALATLLPLERGAFARWVLGVAASPLVTACAAWALLRAGLPLPVAARALAIGAAATWLVTEAFVAPRADAAAGPRPGARAAWGWSLGAAAVIGVMLFQNPWLRVRVDAWIHAGIVMEILERGIPPQDPRFAGLTLNYVWFYNLFVALLTTLRGGGDPFAFMGVANVGSMFATVGLGWLIGRQAWHSARAATGAAALTALAFNAAVWLTWPLRWLTAFTGKVRGWEKVRLYASHTHWNTAEVVYDLSSWRGRMVNFLDKPLHGTAINIAYVFLMVYLWAMVRALRGQRGAALVWGAAAAAGMLFFHGVVGLSALPSALGALGLAWLLPRRWLPMPPRSRVVAFALATLAGMLVAAPYTIAISKAWPAAKSGLHHQYIALGDAMVVTTITSLAVALWFGRRSLARLRAEHRAAAAVLALFALAMFVFTALVQLPDASEAKFAFEVFVPVAALAGVAYHDELAAWRRRFGPAGAAALFVVLLASTHVLTLRGFLLDRSGEHARELHPAPGEDALYGWMRSTTPPGAVFVDFGYRDLIMVKARRQLLLASAEGPEKAAFPLGELLVRRAVMADLYRGADSLDRDVAVLRALRRPAYVLVRAEDADSTLAPAVRLAARPDLFERAYDRDGYTVFGVRPAPEGGRP